MGQRPPLSCALGCRFGTVKSLHLVRLRDIGEEEELGEQEEEEAEGDKEEKEASGEDDEEESHKNKKAGEDAAGPGAGAGQGAGTVAEAEDAEPKASEGQAPDPGGEREAAVGAGAEGAPRADAAPAASAQAAEAVPESSTPGGEGRIPVGVAPALPDAVTVPAGATTGTAVGAPTVDTTTGAPVVPLPVLSSGSPAEPGALTGEEPSEAAPGAAPAHMGPVEKVGAGTPSGQAGGEAGGKAGEGAGVPGAAPGSTGAGLNGGVHENGVAAARSSPEPRPPSPGGGEIGPMALKGRASPGAAADAGKADAEAGPFSTALVVQGESPSYLEQLKRGAEKEVEPWRLGRVYVEFSREESARKAAHALHGRLYDGRRVTCAFFPLRWYQRKFGKGLKPKTHDEKQEAALAIQAYLTSHLPDID